ncbi:MAG: heme transporter ATP-binding protein [Alphaproteobacteria bacterium]|jgi:iron complex transport system ATP-binding protein|nr:heme transporter ATP-binding protein [Alphaproteobacteria bacterium]
MLRTDNVSVTVAGKRLIDGISLALRPGEMLAVVGPNGAGKSTLLRALSGEARIADGKVTLDGKTLKQIGPEALALRRAVLPQETRLAFSLTVEQVVQLGRLPHRGRSDRIQDRIATSRALEAVDMSDFSQRAWPTLSGGERQRVNLARVLAQLDIGGDAAEPRYLLLDEPTAALDLKHQLALLKLLRAQVGQGIGVLAILHDLNQALLADRVAVLAAGRLIALGAPDEVLTPDFVRQAYEVEARLIDLPGGGRLIAAS